MKRFEVMERNIPMSKRSINELREIAVSLGADKKTLYGTSKTAMIFVIDQLKMQKEQ